MDATNNYPHGYREEQPNHFPMPEANEQEDAREQLYNEYHSPGQSMEDFCDFMADELGPDWIFKLSRKSHDR